MARSKSDTYETDPTDGLRREIVGDWSPEKHARLRRYVDITRATRPKFEHSGSTYIDLYCGPGRARVRNTNEILDGSSVVAALEASKYAPFTSIHIGDIDPINVDACTKRLSARGIAAQRYEGAACETAKQVVKNLNPSGLHLAFLDPFSLGALPFSVIQTLSTVKRMDLLIHVSVMDLQRNARSFIDSSMEEFAPGCSATASPGGSNQTLVVALFRHWRQLVENLGYKVSANVERVSSGSTLLYWLVLASKHELADRFWSQVSHVQPQGRLPF